MSKDNSREYGSGHFRKSNEGRSMSAICYDQRRPCPIDAPHGVHHWQARIPLTRRSHLCLTLTSGRYFVPMVERSPRLLRAALPFAAVAIVRRQKHAPSLTHMRWCAHIDVREA